MTLALSVAYRSASDLASHLQEHAARGALLLALRELPAVQQFERVELEVQLPEERCELTAEVVQAIPGLGLVVRLLDPELAGDLAGEVDGSQQAQPPQVSLAAAEAPAEEAPSLDEPAVRTMGPLTWPVEKLQAEWGSLNMADKVRVAKYGKRPARGLILRMIDATLHNVLLSNPQITPEEVAALAGLGSIDAALLKRIASSQEWLRHSAVARNIVCHPKATLPQVTKVMEHLSDNELRQLTRTGKVRASVKRLIIKKLEQRAGRR